MSKKRKVKVQQQFKKTSEISEKTKYKSISDYFSEQIHTKLEKLTEIQKRDQFGTHIVGIRQYTCINGHIHEIKVLKYDDSSIWVVCSNFGWFEKTELGKSVYKLGCKDRKKRCTWFWG